MCELFSCYSEVRVCQERENIGFTSIFRDKNFHAPETWKTPIESGFFGDISFLHILYVKVEQKRYFFLKFHIDVNLWKITVRKSSLSDFNGRRCPTAVQYRILRTVNPQEQMEAVSRNRKPVWPVSFRFILLNIDIYRTVLVLFKGYSVTDGITVDRIRNEEIIANPLDYVKQFICAQNI